MGDVVNLNQFRKRRERAEKDSRAAQNRSQFGRSKSERNRRDTEKDAERRGLDGKRIEPPQDEDEK